MKLIWNKESLTELREGTLFISKIELPTFIKNIIIKVTKSELIKVIINITNKSSTIL